MSTLLPTQVKPTVPEPSYARTGRLPKPEPDEKLQCSMRSSLAMQTI